MYDLLLRGARVIDPASGHDGVADVAFTDARVAAREPEIDPATARTVLDVSGMLVVPGLIDLHTHVYWRANPLGVDPARVARENAVTTLVDAGSAGGGTFDGLATYIAAPSPVRILAYVNISFAGILTRPPEIRFAEAAHRELLRVEDCVAAARAHPDLCVGVKVRIGLASSGELGTEAMDLALEAAEELALPLMAHIGGPPPGVDAVVEKLRPGDILTHCCRPKPNAAVADADDRLRASFAAARERGVVFDVGHGAGAFGFGTTRAMLEQGFAPDVISSDVHHASIDGPAYGLLATMDKFLALGMPLAEVVARATLAPARALRRDDLGRLAPGAAGDASILRLAEGPHELADVTGETITATSRLAAAAKVVAGRAADAA